MHILEFITKALAWRHIEPENSCFECGGSGIKMYANTATYHPHFIAGQAITPDVCNKCWGSGDKTKHWPSHLKMAEQETSA